MSAPKSPNLASVKTTDAPFMSVKELRKVLGSDVKELSDEKIRELSVGLGEIALLIVNNPKTFNNLIKPKEVKNE